MKKNERQKNIKICAVISEYNPFHNGHLHQLNEIRRISGCDAVLCVMSGNFVQRGEAAILDKYTRATHAVAAGADCVIELPVPFAAANAEKFALGAIKLLSAIPAVTVLAFGCEHGHAADFLSLARILTNEPPAFKKHLKEALCDGASFAKARFTALRKTYPQADERLFSMPNNILGLEYSKAILRLNAGMRILPLQRVGAGYTDGILRENYSSASAIRAALLQSANTAALADNVPEYVFRDFPLALNRESYEKLDTMEYYALINRSAAEIALAPDCTEGLENRLKNLTETCFTAEDVIREGTSRRYTAARVRRILLAGTLGITACDTDALLNENSYCNVLAVNAKKADALLSALKEGGLPLLVRTGDETALSGAAKTCYESTGKADGIYAALCKRKSPPRAARFVLR